MHNKKSRRNKVSPSVGYSWILNKYIGPSTETEMGRYSPPVNDLKNGLTSDFVLQELNKGNCFDFEYRPNNGDNLVLTKKSSETRMEFIFQHGEWVEDHYSPFDHEWKKIDYGKIVRSED